MASSSLAQFPAIADMLNQIGAVSTPFFNALLFLGEFIIGIFLAALVLQIIIGAFQYLSDRILETLFGRHDPYDGDGWGKRGTARGMVVDLRPPSSTYFQK